MHVEKILPNVQEPLEVIHEGAALVEAAARLRGPHANLVVVCDRDGAIRGVVTKTDLVDRMSECAGASCTRSAASVMSQEVVSCRPDATLREVWSVMRARGLKHMPVADADGRALGILSAREVVQALVDETEQEEQLLRDYVMCVGYR